MEMDEDDVTPLEALGLHRVGQPLPQRPHLPTPPPLNKRGMPARIRKKNPMYFDENLVSNILKSPRGSPRKNPSSKSNSANSTPKKQPQQFSSRQAASPASSNSIVRTPEPSPPPTSPSVRSPHFFRSSIHTRSSEKSNMGYASTSRSIFSSSQTESASDVGVASTSHSAAALRALSTRGPVKQDSHISMESSLSDASPDSSPPQSPSFIQEDCKPVDIEPPNLMQLNLDSSTCSSKSVPSGSSAPSNNIPTSNTTLTDEQRQAAHLNGLRLRNFLKLPQAHKWIYYEWFYANIDRPLFLGPNDFEQVLSEAFPHLKTRQLTRRQWSIVRRCMGKPRRCSQAFFNEELGSLAKRRQVLRLLQQRKITDVSQLRDLPFSLPSLIPCQLVIGTKVTARIRKPENGLYTGRIDAVDTSNNTYRITFSNGGIGTHSIPDYEVLSCDPPEMMPLASFQQKFRPRPPLGLVTPPRPILPRSFSNDAPHINSMLGGVFDSPTFMTNDPVLAQAPRHTPPSLGMGDTIGQYPVESLMHVVRLLKLLEDKSHKVSLLDQLNSDAEKMICTGGEITTGFQRKYATLVLDVDTLNEDLNSELLFVNSFCQQISGGTCESTCPQLLPNQIQERCTAEAMAVVHVCNSAAPDPVTDSDALKLVTSLTALMLQIKNLGETEVSAFELSSLQTTLNSIREEMEDKELFRDLVDVPLTHIMAAASQTGPLNAFTASAHN